ncbi:CbiX/SirB N-terminal domain-containing protein [Nocardia sp. NPDC050435]|uniref:sirohydrochlorin chelatase n=1 Tax=Nocardia sp. NPDC050435 TaxID=3155040 RepID=UPI0033C801F6
MIAVAHGSRDPRSAATMAAVVAEIAAARPDLDVRLAFLDLSAPSVEQVVDAVAAQGHTHVVVAPLLLGSAFHARSDLPALLDAARAGHPQLRITQAEVLGPDPRLVEALRDRVLESAPEAVSRHADHVRFVDLAGPGAAAQSLDAARQLDTAQDPRTARRPDAARQLGNPQSLGTARRLGVAVAAVGSSAAAANARSADVARRLALLTGWHTEICFATTEPSVTEAISRLRARGAGDVLVAPWFLAPGLLTDRLAALAPDLVHANVIGPHAALTGIVWDRYDAAATTLALSA